MPNGKVNEKSLPFSGFNHLMFPKWFVGLILGTTNPQAIDIDAENQ